jgi:lipopolysaccharide transport system ATP-binding protein
MRGDGASQEVVKQYIELGRETRGEVVWDNPASAPGNDKLRFHAVRLISDGEVTNDIDIEKDICIEIEYWNFVPDTAVSVSIHLFDRMNVVVLASANMHSANLLRDEWFGKPFPAGLFRTTCVLPGNFLNEGMYSINAILLTDVGNVEARLDEVVSFTVHETGAMRKEFGGHWIGVVRPKLAWQTRFVAPLNGGLP